MFQGRESKLVVHVAESTHCQHVSGRDCTLTKGLGLLIIFFLYRTFQVFKKEKMVHYKKDSLN